MADNVTIDPGSGGAVVSTEEITTLNGGAVSAQHVQRMLLAYRTSDGIGVDLLGDAANGLDVDVTRSALPTGASTAAKQPALGTAGTASADVLSIQGVASMTPVKVDGSGVTQPVSGTVTATGPLTDTQLRATAVPVSGTVTASGPLTDTQLRATAVPVSGTVTASGPVTDTQLRASAVPVSLATLPALVAGTAAIGKLAANSGVTIGDVNLVSAVPAGTNNIGLLVPTPGATGGWSKVKYAAQTTTVVKPKGTAGTFGGYLAYNPNGTVAYIQVFDLATATTVTLGTTVPDMIFGIPAGSAANLEITLGVNMALGMQLACTTTALGSTAPGTGLDLTIFFK